MAHIELAQESLVAAFPEATVLWGNHWQETEVEYRAAPMNPDYDQFARLEEANWGRYFTARVDGRLAGHLFFIVHKDRHTQVKVAVEDFFYFRPEYRKGFNAVKLLTYARDILKAEGCKQVGMSSKLTGGVDLAPLMQRLGARHIANFYVM